MTSKAEQSTARPSEPGNPKLADDEPSLWSIISPVNRAVYTAMALAVISVLCWFAAIMVFWPIMQELTGDTPDQGRIWRLFGYGALAVVGAFVSRVLAFHVSHVASFDLEKILRTEMSDHLARVPLGYVMTTGSGALKKVLLDDVRALHAFVADSTPLFAKAFSTPIVGVLLLFIVDWRLALATLAPMPIGMVGMTLAFRDYDEIRKKVDAANERINSVIIEYVQGMQVVRTFDDGSSSLRRYQDALSHATQALSLWTEKTQIGAHIARTLFSALPTLLVVWTVGTWLYKSGSIGLPELVVALAIGPTISESILPIVWLQQFIINSSAAVKRINALRRVATQPAPQNPQTPKDASFRAPRRFTKQSVAFRAERTGSQPPRMGKLPRKSSSTPRV